MGLVCWTLVLIVVVLGVTSLDFGYVYTITFVGITYVAEGYEKNTVTPKKHQCEQCYVGWKASPTDIATASCWGKFM